MKVHDADRTLTGHRMTEFLKGIAILLIVLVHSHQTFDLHPVAANVLSFSQTATYLFFMLSAYGICFSYDKNKVNWPTFMRRRVGKLAPLYWTAIAVTAVYHLLYALVMSRSVLEEVNPLGVVINGLFLHGLFADLGINNLIVRGGWFVGTVVLLYAAFPALHKLYNANNEKWKRVRLWAFPLGIYILTALLSQAVRLIPNQPISTTVLDYSTPFCFGFVLHDLNNRAGDREKIRYAWLWSLLSLIPAATLYFTGAGVFNLGALFLSVFFFFLALSIMQAQPYSNRLTRLVCHVGKHSYAIYLFHSFVAFDVAAVILWVLRKVYPNDTLWYLILLPIVIVLSYLVGFVLDSMIGVITRKSKNNDDKKA